MHGWWRHTFHSWNRTRCGWLLICLWQWSNNSRGRHRHCLSRHLRHSGPPLLLSETPWFLLLPRKHLRMQKQEFLETALQVTLTQEAPRLASPDATSVLLFLSVTCSPGEQPLHGWKQTQLELSCGQHLLHHPPAKGETAVAVVARRRCYFQQLLQARGPRIEQAVRDLLLPTMVSRLIIKLRLSSCHTQHAEIIRSIPYDQDGEERFESPQCKTKRNPFTHEMQRA